MIFLALDQQGGTLIGTQRSKAFREIEGRRKAVHNLIKHGINALIVCGGDGSLTGADKLRAEWSDHVKALLAAGRFSQRCGAIDDIRSFQSMLITSVRHFIQVKSHPSKLPNTPISSSLVLSARLTMTWL